jgi:hypothetical protein
MFAKVILASKPTNGAPPIITIHARYPRIIHGEVMTHRVFSRNARSSRAVPVTTMLQEICETPFVPWHWGKNQKGMQASEECNEMVKFRNDAVSREAAWLRARDNALTLAENFAKAGYHKQVVNRLIEPFSWIDTLITSTNWANFFHLRDHPDAEPHFRDLAQLIKAEINDATFGLIDPGQWHLPYVTPRELFTGDLETCQRLSVARCARISYKPFDGDGSIKKELERYELLVGSEPLHASPAEHQATPDTKSHYERLLIECNKEELLNSGPNWDNPHLSGNLNPGWIQFRKTLTGEFVRAECEPRT